MNNGYTNLKRLTLCFIFLIMALLTKGQPIDLWKNDSTDRPNSHPRYSFIELKAYYGWHLPTPSEEFNRTIELNPWTGGALRYGWKADGRKAWHSWHNYPSYGFGLFSCTFIPEENIVGTQTGYFFGTTNLYGFGKNFK